MAGIIKPEDVVTVDVNVAKDLLASGSRYLDVRTAEEYNNGHVDNAVSVPYMFMTQQGRVKNPDFLPQVSLVCKREERLVVGCNIGGRAMKACVDLLNDGYQQVTRMGGGYTAWAESRQETNK
ncbi:protein HIGH ARSENIC CONTENT 1, mitochondrial [Daucus carota subsp. sativus]|uniref:Rhodanese domain-containing protein n=1 Tax=Daucus carota subsp. sativus TaxID=79200 RepID=A0A161Y0W3_DAUCS|nr:PREDICTED: rhodanese-like domain-containing protein 19, mitochondrial [Daucus carota subsp. sativus]